MIVFSIDILNFIIIVFHRRCASLVASVTKYILEMQQKNDVLQLLDFHISMRRFSQTAFDVYDFGPDSFNLT